MNAEIKNPIPALYSEILSQQFLFLFLVCVCVCPHNSWKTVSDSLELESGCEAPCGCWNLNSGPLPEQPGALSHLSSPLPYLLYYRI